MGAIRGRCARAMASLAQSRRFTLTRARSAGSAPCFTAERALEDETAAAIRTTLRETGYLLDPHTAVAVAVAEKETRDPAIRWWCSRPPIRRSFPMPSKPPAASARHCPTGSPGSMTKPERFTVLPADQAAVENHILAHSRAAREGATA